MIARLILVLAVLCACSSPPPAVPPPAPAVTLRAGTSGDYPPLSVWTNERPRGFAPELVDAYARHENATVDWTRFKWPELTSDLRAGRFDVAADGITVRPERSIEGRFTVPIARGGAVLLVRRPSWATALTVEALDRPELRVVVNAGAHLERVTRRLFHSATITAIPNNAGARDAFLRGDADAAMTNTFEAPLWSASTGTTKLEQVGPLTHDTTALWVRADRGDLAESLDEWLLAEEESGQLSQLRAKALGGGAPTARVVDALLAATAERLALMPLVAAAKQRMGKATEDAAQEERVLAAAADGVGKAAAKHKTAPPPRPLIDGFFRAQIEAAKNVQSRTPATPGASGPDLDKDLRPAIARITARMAFLLVRLPPTLQRDAIAAEARDELAESNLDADHIDQLTTALAAFSRGR
jgi:cyclohexadienyl dehydratase